MRSCDYTIQAADACAREAGSWCASGHRICDRHVLLDVDRRICAICESEIASFARSAVVLTSPVILGTFHTEAAA